MQKLKKLLMIILIVSLPLCAYSIEWITANQKAIGWDAPTTLTDGNPIPPEDTIKYNVYLVNAITDPNKTNPALLTPAPITATTFLITLNTEGQYIAGVKALRYNTADELVSESTINWSDVNGDSTPNPFGIRFYAAPAQPANLHAQ